MDVNLLVHGLVVVVILLKLFLDVPLIIRKDPPDVKALRERGWHNLAQAVPLLAFGLGLLAFGTWGMLLPPPADLPRGAYWLLQASCAVTAVAGAFLMRYVIRRVAAGRAFLEQAAARAKDPDR